MTNNSNLELSMHKLKFLLAYYKHRNFDLYNLYISIADRHIIRTIKVYRK